MNSLAIRVLIDGQLTHSNNLNEENFMNPSSSLSSKTKVFFYNYF